MISIVVPCYNEEKNISKLVKRFEEIEEKMIPGELELILVDNGSKDDTQNTILNCIASHPYMHMVKVKENAGYGFGVLEGMRACTGEWIGWIHADLQLPPEAFADFYAITKERKPGGKDLFFKAKRRNRPLGDRFFTIGMALYESLVFGVPLWDIYAQPTMMSRSFYSELKDVPYDFTLDLYIYLMAKKTKREIVRVPVKQCKRTAGVSSWNNGKLKSKIRFVKNTIYSSKDIKKKQCGKI